MSASAMAIETPRQTTVTINSIGPAGSFDPITHDSFNSTIIFKNVNPRLISLGTGTEPRGFLANSWHISADRLLWTFNIRPNINFEDATPLTPEVIAKNLKRILWLTRQDKTQLHSKLAGFKEWIALDQPFKGISWNQSQVFLHFDIAPEDLFETLDQALYGVIPLQSFDPHSGKINDKKPSSAGYYNIESINSDSIHLKKNPQWSTQGPDQIILRWDTIDLKKMRDAQSKYDLFITNGMGLTSSSRVLFAGTDLDFILSPPALMNFVQLNASKSIFHDADLRKAIRNHFYKTFFVNAEAKKYFSLSNSFLPKGTPGYEEHFETEKVLNYSSTPRQKAKLAWWPPSHLDEANQLILSSITSALKDYGIEVDIQKCRDRQEMFNRVRENDFDVVVRLTGVLVRNPFSDMKLMFQSKMGALIPDVNGKISVLLNEAETKSNPMTRKEIAKRINKQVYEDASVLTYSHSGQAYIYNQKRISIDRFNLGNDPFDFTSIDTKF